MEIMQSKGGNVATSARQHLCVSSSFSQTTILKSISFERFESPGIRVAAASYVAILMQPPSFYHKLLAQSRISCTEKNWQ